MTQRQPCEHTGYRVDQTVLRHLHGALKRARPTVVTSSAHERVAKAIAEGYIRFSNLDDYLYNLDTDMAGPLFTSAKSAAEMFEIRYERIYLRPRLRDVRAGGWIGSCAPSFTPAQAAAWLIRYENLGFDCHPELWTEALLPAIRRKEYITDEECTIVLHKKERNRMRIRRDLYDPKLLDAEVTTERFVTPNGTHVRADITGDRQVRMISLDRLMNGKAMQF